MPNHDNWWTMLNQGGIPRRGPMPNMPNRLCLPDGHWVYGNQGVEKCDATYFFDEYGNKGFEKVEPWALDRHFSLFTFFSLLSNDHSNDIYDSRWWWCDRSLNLGYCKKLTDAELSHLKELQRLASLDIGDCDKITDSGLAHLQELEQLTRLNLPWTMTNYDFL